MSSSPTDALLSIEGLSKSYGKDCHSCALRDVGFTLRRGELVSVIGLSGAGKSTLLRCINRMIDFESGSIVFDGQEVAGLRRRELRNLRRKISMIFQHYNLVQRLTTIENVLHGRLGYKSTLAGMLGLYSEAEKLKALDILAQLGIIEFSYVRTDQLSGGQKQRVGIARALVQDPLLVLCDEPVASLDPKSARVIMGYLRAIADTMGITCLVNLHQVDYALEYSDRILALRGGELVYDGLPGQLSAEKIAEIYGMQPAAPAPEPAEVLIGETLAGSAVAALANTDSGEGAGALVPAVLPAGAATIALATEPLAGANSGDAKACPQTEPLPADVREQLELYAFMTATASATAAEASKERSEATLVTEPR